MTQARNTFREITTHEVAGLPPKAYAELRVVAIDADPHGIPHHYELLERIERPIVHHVVFQTGDPRKGWNGGTSLAFLAVVHDFLVACQASPFACIENEAAIGHVEQAMECLRQRVVRRHAEGTFQTHTTGPGEAKA